MTGNNDFFFLMLRPFIFTFPKKINFDSCLKELKDNATDQMLFIVSFINIRYTKYVKYRVFLLTLNKSHSLQLLIFNSAISICYT